MTTRKLISCLGILLFVQAAVAQVDTESRRTLLVETSLALKGNEQPSAFGYYWFNQNDYPWTNTALRIIFSGVYADSEFSWFLPANTNIAAGFGLGGGLFINSVTPYKNGGQLENDEFYGDIADARVFLNETIPNPSPLPLNLRATYMISGSFFRDTASTSDFTLPSNFLTQTALAEFRYGGAPPGLTARRAAELYLAADANYRGDFEAFGPDGALLPAHSEYQRAYGALTARFPLQQTTFYAHLAGGYGHDLDEISAYKIGGNLLGVEPFTVTVHGYYTREFLAGDFTAANTELRQQLTDWHAVALHLYGDWAILKPVPPDTPDWHNILGVGTAVSFRAVWNTYWLISYGYGINAVRDGHNGGHEVGLALQKQF
ncbi:MAG TPA: hypothetical protein VMP11_17915 [Verrucomicrobiae bacterium]|nr:hypothetical protein [Verrucomicrobiae bacterium]